MGIPDIKKPARTPLYTTGNEERSGMGFTIMESFMDSVRVRSKEGKGTTVILRKRFSPGQVLHCDCSGDPQSDGSRPLGRQ